MTSYHNILQQNICVLNVFEKLSAESWPPLHALRCHKQGIRLHSRVNEKLTVASYLHHFKISKCMRTQHEWD